MESKYVPHEYARFVLIEPDIASLEHVATGTHGFPCLCFQGVLPQLETFMIAKKKVARSG